MNIKKEDLINILENLIKSIKKSDKIVNAEFNIEREIEKIQLTNFICNYTFTGWTNIDFKIKFYTNI